MRIHTFDCILEQHTCFANAIERYLYLDGISNRFGYHKYTVVKKVGDQTFLKEIPPQPMTIAHFLTTCAKIISYLTIILPLLALTAKGILSSDYHSFVPLSTKRHLPSPPPSPAINPQELQELVRTLADTDEGFPQTPLQLLAKEMERDLGSRVEEFKSRLSEILTPQTLRSNKSYLTAYRQFLRDHPGRSLSPPISLMNTKGQSHQVDRLLAFTTSPIIEMAFQKEMLEKKNETFCSEYFDGTLEKIASFIQNGWIEYGLLNPQCPFDIYPTAHFLEMTDLLAECRKNIYDNLLKFDVESLKVLWELGETYQDRQLQSFCLKAILNDSSILKEMPLELQSLRVGLSSFHSAKWLDWGFQGDFRVGWQRPSSNTEVAYRLSNREIRFYHDIGVTNARIPYPENDNENISLLRKFKFLYVSAQAAHFYTEILTKNTQLRELSCDIKSLDTLQAIATALKENSVLKELTLHVDSEFKDMFYPRVLDTLFPVLLQNSSLTRLNIYCRLRTAQRKAINEAIASRPVALNLKIECI
jgi:hypothetical protein